MAAELASGELVTAIAMTEPGTGSDLQGVRTTAKQIRQRLRAQRLEDLHHQRPAANLIIVVAKTDPKQGAKGVSLIVVETDDAAGLPPRPQAREDGHGFGGHLGAVLRGLPLPAENLLGTEGPGLLSAHEGAAAGAAVRRRPCRRP